MKNPDYTEEFEAFWQKFPRKTEKPYAAKCYAKARRQGATADEILNGIANYLAAKPEYADFCHPSTFLNKGRWMDEPDSTLASQSKPIGQQNMRLLSIVDKLAG